MSTPARAGPTRRAALKLAELSPTALVRSSGSTISETKLWRAGASNAEATNPSVMAVDGRIDDYWSSGGYPTQWVEIDLQRATRITRVRLVAPDLPEGVPVLVLGRSDSPTSAYRLLHRFAGPAVFKQELTFTPRRPWRGVRFVRLQVPLSQSPMGWVSWPEIEIYSRPR